MEDDLGSYKHSEWRFYELRANQNYFEYPNTSNMEPGRAFWLIVKEPGKRINTGAGITIRTDTVFSIFLHPKWNFIGNPFNFAIPVQNIRLKNTGKSPTLRVYKGSWNDPVNDPVGEMQPFDGYAVKNALTFQDTLLINPEITDTTSALHKAAHDLNAKTMLWSIRILGQCQEARDVDNIAAIVSSASDSWDEMDQPEPPVIGEYVSVYFRHPEWEKLATKYCTDIRPKPTDGEIWEFEVKSNISDKINLYFAGLESVPEEDEIWLIDEVVPIAQNLRQNKSYVVAASSPEHPKWLKLVVGKHDFVKEKIADTQVIPTTYELNQNFPNPFNPATTIRYGLPQDERVTLKIYNLLGEEVVTLMNDELQPAGYHVAIWDGRNKLGEMVGSGVYIYRFRAGSFTAIKKMALVK